MKTYEFSIIASGPDPNADDFESRFYDAGCDDALVAFQKGRIILDFAREAGSAEEALTSALSDVRRAGAHVEHIEPDPLVSLSDIAKRAGLTRAAVTHFAKGERGSGFPAPAARITTDSPLWQWADVADWLVKRGTLSEEFAIEAHVVHSANIQLQLTANATPRKKPSA